MLAMYMLPGLEACCHILTTFVDMVVINILEAISLEILTWPILIFVPFAHVIGK